MESLALLVTMLFFSIILIGPISWGLTIILPTWLGKTLCFISLIVGLWWFFLPIGPARFFSVPTVLLSLKGLYK
jgi:hypothetical protein